MTRPFLTHTPSSPRLLAFTERAARYLELNAVSELVSDHEAQLFNYLRIARKQVGYLLNFGRRGELLWQRFVLSDLHSLKQERNTDQR